MCGLAGAFSQFNLNDKQRLTRARVVESLLIANAARGTDATGLAAVCGDERCIYKKAMPSYRFVDEDEARRVARLPKAPILIGHTRYATTGKNTDANAHPFLEGNVVGAHNGVISNYHSIEAYVRSAYKVDYKDWVFSDVDSQSVFKLFNLVGPAGYIEAIEQIRGSAALVWHDKRNSNGLWMVAHTNPLNVAYVPSIATLFWASQYDHLSSVLWSAFGTAWMSVAIKENMLYLFTPKALLKPQVWPVKFGDPINSYGSYTGYTWKDEDDADVKHPYAVAKVTRKDEGKGKVESGGAGVPQGSTSSNSPLTITSETSRSSANTLSVLHRMGIPVLGESPTGESDSPLDSYEAESDGTDDVTPVSDGTCSVCMETIEETTGRYYDRTGQWVCATCVSFWEDEGQGNLLEAMGHYAAG